MRLLPYFILAYVAIGLQIGLGAHLRVGGAKPDLVLLAVVFVAMNAPREAALLGCFGIGAMQDLVTAQPLGLYALGYSLAAMSVVGAHHYVRREHPLTHIALALGGSMIVSIVLLVHGWILGPALSISTLFASSIYTAAVAPLVLLPLQRVRRVFAFKPSRRKLAW